MERDQLGLSWKGEVEKFAEIGFHVFRHRSFNNRSMALLVKASGQKAPSN